MRVLFLKDVSRVARAGEVMEVADGFARNYLIPKGMATPATHEQLKRIESIKKAAEETRLKELQDLEALARELEGTAIMVKAKVSPGGKYYGAVTSVHIAEELGKLTNRQIDRHVVELKEPIQEPGEYTATLNLHPTMTTTINIKAEGEE